MNSSWIITWTLNPMTSVLVRDKQKRDAERGEGHVKMKAEIGVMQPQAKGLQNHHKLEEAGRILPLEAS